jgi:hypothetical protein
MINEKVFEAIENLNRKHWLGMKLQNAIHFGRSGNEGVFDSLIDIEVERLNLLKNKETNEPRKKAMEESLELIKKLKVTPKDKSEAEKEEKGQEGSDKLDQKYSEGEGRTNAYSASTPIVVIEDVQPNVGMRVSSVHQKTKSNRQVPKPPERLKFGREDGVYKVPETKEEYKKTGDSYEYAVKGNKADQIKVVQQMVDHFVENGGKEAELRGTDKNLLHIACYRLQEHGITKIKLPEGIDPPMIQAPPRFVK